jgi:hypothetical protein
MRPRSWRGAGAPSSRPATVRLVVALLFCCLAVVVYVRTVDLTRRVFPGSVWGTAPQIQVSEPKVVARELTASGFPGGLWARPWRSWGPWDGLLTDLASPDHRQRTAILTRISLPPPHRFSPVRG